MRASNLHKPHPILRLSPYHACIKPAQTSPTPASETLSCEHQTCTNLTYSCVWILLVPAPNLHKPRPHLRLNPSHKSIKPAQTTTTLASESFSCLHQTNTNFPYSCVWILVMRVSNLHKPRPLLRLSPSQTSIKPAQTTTTLASGSFSCLHQTCANFTHSCVWILNVRVLDLHKPRPLLRLNPSLKSIKPAQTTTKLASESFSCLHQTNTNFSHSCVWILIMRASNLHKHRPLLRLSPSQTSIKPAQTTTTLASGSFSCVHQTCANFTHSCVRILNVRALDLHKPHPLLRLNSYHASIKPAQTSPNPASESLSCMHQTCTNITHSCVWNFIMRASNLHKPNLFLCLNPSRTCTKSAQTSSTPASESFS